METLYELTGVAKFFQRGDATVRALDGVDLYIEAGEFVTLEGPSGSGKTTLLQLLGALDRPSAGHVLFEGNDLAELPDHELAGLRLRSFGFVFQQFNLIPTLTAVENVEAYVQLIGKPAIAVARRLILRKPRVCLCRIGRLHFDARAVPECRVVHRIAAPAHASLMLTRTYCENNTGYVSGADDDVLCLGRTMDEVPLPQRPLLALDDEKRLPGEHEEVLLVGFPVVHPDRHTRREHAK